MRREVGAVGLVAAALAATAMVVCLLVVDVARVAAARAQLTTAADAGALAAAPVTFSAFGTNGDPVAAAAEMALGNGAQLSACECDINRSWVPRRVVVTVTTLVHLALLPDRALTATAAAEFRPVALAQR